MRNEFSKLYHAVVSFLDPEREVSVGIIDQSVRTGSNTGTYFVACGNTLDSVILKSYLSKNNPLKELPREFISRVCGRTIIGTHPELRLSELKALHDVLVDPMYKPKMPPFLIFTRNFIGLCGGCVFEVESMGESIEPDELIKAFNVRMEDDRRCTALIVCKDEKTYSALKPLIKVDEDKRRKQDLTEVFETKSFIYTR